MCTEPCREGGVVQHSQSLGSQFWVGKALGRKSDTRGAGRAEQEGEGESLGCWLVKTTRAGIISAEPETWVRWQSGNGGGEIAA